MESRANFQAILLGKQKLNYIYWYLSKGIQVVSSVDMLDVTVNNKLSLTT